MKSVYAAKKLCCGCGACAEACPVNAVTMLPDEEGFLYPDVDASVCTDCRNCRSVCSILWQKKLKEPEYPTFYAAKHKSADVLKHSSSGGAFTAISDAILKKGGIVYGADFDEDFRVLHRRATTPEERDRFCRSKYAQSATREAYGMAVRDLREGKTVLFTGTPCQTAGLRGLMQKKIYPDRLYTCDVICHSVPSPRIWKDFKMMLERENGGKKLAEVHFRTKDIAWNRPNSNVGFQYRVEGSDEYVFDHRFFDLFFGVGTIVRRSCYACPFTDVHRASDITIADCFGIEKYMPEFNDERGVSLVMINSPKGAALFEEARRDMETVERPAEESLANQQRLSHPAEEPENMEQFWRDYRERGFSYVMKKYLPKV